MLQIARASVRFKKQTVNQAVTDKRDKPIPKTR